MSAPGGKAVGQLEQGHAVGEGPGRAGAVGVLAGGPIDGQAGAFLDAGYEQVAAELLIGHEPVEVGVGQGEGAIGGGERGERIVAARDGPLEQLGLLLERGRDDRGFERLPCPGSACRATVRGSRGARRCGAS